MDFYCLWKVGIYGSVVLNRLIIRCLDDEITDIIPLRAVLPLCRAP